MKILHCIATLGEGGSELQLSQLAAAQARAGLEVHLAVRQEGSRAAGLRAAGVSLHRLEARGNHNPMLYWQLARLVKALRPDLLQTWLLQMDVVGGLAARRTGVPWVLTERSSRDCHDAGWKGSARAYIARAARAIVSNSHGGDAYWASRIHSAIPRCVIPNILPVEQIAASQSASSEAVGLPPGHRMVLAVGRLSSEKNLDNLLEGVRRLSQSLAVDLYMCGLGPDEARLRRLAASVGLGERVHFCGFVSPIWSWMKRADVYVSVSRFEGLPNAVLEAMASRCPMVLSDISSHRELLDDRCAVFVDPESPASIAEGLLRALQDREGATERAALARHKVSECSPDDIAKKYQVVYDAVLRGAPLAASPRESTCAG